jgi:Protein of unknown function (DUF4232)
MSPHSAHALPLALVAGSMILTAAACGGSAGQSPSAGSSGASATSAASVSASELPTAAPTPTPSSASTSTTSSPAGAGCTVGALQIRYADDKGGGGAGSVTGTLTFTNTGSAACTLRGFPGVSYVGGGKGTQVGQPASRTDDAVKTRTLAPGSSVKSALRRTQPGGYGDECQQTEVDGFRVYPPGSTESAFVAFKTTGCKSTSAPLLQVGPVR